MALLEQRGCAAGDQVDVKRWGYRFKHLEVPAAYYATLLFDAVFKEGALAGLSAYPVYTAKVRGWFSLAMLDEDQAIDGNEVTLI